MIYLTGDLHGDLERFKSKEMKKLKKAETSVFCGTAQKRSNRF